MTVAERAVGDAVAYDHDHLNSPMRAVSGVVSLTIPSGLAIIWH